MEKEINSNIDLYDFNERIEFIKNNYHFLRKDAFDFNLDPLEHFVKHDHNIYSFKALNKEIALSIINECSNFSKSKMPIISPNPFSINSENENCIINEFAKLEVIELVRSLINFLRKLFPTVNNLDDSDFLAFFTSYSGSNYSRNHVDESHISVIICLNEEFEGGELVFNNSIEVKQIPYHAIAFFGNIPHYSKETKGQRFNLNFYLKQFNENFYEGEYIEYLSNMGINNCDSVSKNAFTIPFLSKIEEENIPIIYKDNTKIMKKIPNYIYTSIFKYLEKDDLMSIEMVCKNFSKLSQYVWKEMCSSLNNKNCDIRNFKILHKSLTRRTTSLIGNCILPIHIDTNIIGENLIRLVCLKEGINKNILHQSDSENINFLFNEQQNGYFYPRSIFISNSEFNTYLRENTNSDNLYNTNPNLNDNYNTGYEICIEDFEDRIRKEVEKLSKFRFVITCKDTPFSTGLSYNVSKYLKDSCFNKEGIITPLFESYNIYSGLIIKDWEYKFPIMQFEKEVLIKNYNPKINKIPEELIARGIIGLLKTDNDIMKNMVPFPSLSILQQSFSPLIPNNQMSIAQIIYDSIIESVLNNRYQSGCKNLALSLHLYGSIPTKDIMAAIGTIKTKRNIEFVSWSNLGFKIFANETTELINKEIILKSCHSIMNSNDSIPFLNRISKNMEFNNFIDFNKEDYSEVNELIKNMHEDYSEAFIDQPDEENEEI